MESAKPDPKSFYPKKGKGAQQKRKSFTKEYGFLRHGMTKVPRLLGLILEIVVCAKQILVHSFLLGLVLAEAFGLMPGASGKPPEAIWILGAMAYDSLPGLIQAWLGFAWTWDWRPIPDDHASVLRRVVFLYTLTATALHATTLARFRKQPCAEYSPPPLFPFLAYFCAPWCGLSGWLLALREGDRLLGGEGFCPFIVGGCTPAADAPGLAALRGALADVIAVGALFLLRAVVFGRLGLPRLPRTPRWKCAWLLDAVLLGLVAGLVDLLILRGRWLERVKNWKYILTIINIVWPLPVLGALVAYFQGAYVASQAKKAAKAASKVARDTASAARKTAASAAASTSKASAAAAAAAASVRKQGTKPRTAGLYSQLRPRRSAVASTLGPAGSHGPPPAPPPPGMPPVPPSRRPQAPAASQEDLNRGPAASAAEPQLVGAASGGLPEEADSEGSASERSQSGPDGPEEADPASVQDGSEVVVRNGRHGLRM